MTLEIIVFVVAILLGILLYWRESANNRLYRFFNKLGNSKKLQMSETDSKGFLHKQSFLFRLIYILLFYIILFGGVSLLTPLNIVSFQIFTASVVGTLIGTYIASSVFFANKKIEDHKDIIESAMEKGKDVVSDIVGNKDVNSVEEIQKEEKPSKQKEKSARERLKDKGLL